MPILTAPEIHTISAAGGTILLDVLSIKECYDFIPDTGAVTLGADYTVDVSGVPVVGSVFVINFLGGVTKGAHTLSFFGQSFTAPEGLAACSIEYTYATAGWSYKKYLVDDGSANPSIDGANIIAGTISNTALAGNIDPTKLLTSTRGYMARANASGIWGYFNAASGGNLVMGNGTDVVSLPMSGDGTLDASAVLTISALAITTSKIANNAITASKLSTEVGTLYLPIQVSFEATEQGEYRIPIGFACTATAVFTECVRPVAATDNGTIAFANNASVAMTLTSPITYVASSAFGLSYVSAVTANNTFVAGDYIRITPAKVTPGGKVNVWVKVVRS